MTKQDFPGRIGLTIADSEPHFPEPKRTRAGSPNVVIVLLDDVGYSDFGCYGAEIQTPNIDRLASQGLRYNNFRTTAICSPTRASLLTGLNHHSAGMGFLADVDLGFPGYRGSLTHDAPTIAEILRPAGYRTFMVGKWHVNPAPSQNANGPMDNWPAQRGFEQCYWFNLHSMDYFAPYDMYEGNSMIQAGGKDYYITDDFTDKAIGYVRNQKAVAPEQPFLLYLAYNGAHSPLQCPAESRDKYQGRYDRGWDRIREERLQKQKQLGIAPAHTELPPRNPGVKPWDTLTDLEKKVYARYMEVYAGVVDRIDVNIGRLSAFLESIGQFDNTIFLLCSDNGASAEGTPEGTPNLMLTANAQPLSLQEAHHLYDVMGERQTFPHYPRGWAMASNTPFRMYKQFTHLGGVCDPLLVHWPRGIRSKGEVRQQFTHVIDILPTILDAAGVEAPREVNGKAPKPIEGASFRHTFDDHAAAPGRSEQYFEMGGQRAMCADGWRIVNWHKRGVPYESERWELYHLDQDFNETKNLAERYPEKVKELEAKWLAAAAKFSVFPLDDRNFWLKIVASKKQISRRWHWEFHPPVQPISAGASPITGGRSHTIDAEITRPHENADGVIVAYGSRYYGYAIYVLDGYLVYEVAMAPRNTVITSSKKLPTGRFSIRFEMKMVERPLKGVGALYVDSEKVAEQMLEEMPIGVPYDGLDIGRDANVPVSDRYSAPFAFGGTLHRVMFDIDPAPPTKEELLRSARLIQLMV